MGGGSFSIAQQQTTSHTATDLDLPMRKSKMVMSMMSRTRLVLS